MLFCNLFMERPSYVPLTMCHLSGGPYDPDHWPFDLECVPSVTCGIFSLILGFKGFSF